MSDSPVPVYVDTRKIFLQQASIAGFVALERLGRFTETLASDQGTVFVELHFATNDSGQQTISGKLKAEVEVLCQRCLEPLGIVLEDDIKLALLKDEAKISSLEEGLDPWICPDNKLKLASIVEEQLMLCMPIVNYHDTADCSQKLGYTAKAGKAAENGSDEVKNPFAVLKALKQDDGTN